MIFLLTITCHCLNVSFQSNKLFFGVPLKIEVLSTHLSLNFHLEVYHVFYQKPLFHAQKVSQPLRLRLAYSAVEIPLFAITFKWLCRVNQKHRISR